MRYGLCLVAGLLASISSADRLINIPTALKVRYNQARFEYKWEPTKRENDRGYLGVGVTRDLEVEAIFESRSMERIGSLNLTYQYLVPIVDTAPGLAIGVQDAMDRTPDRRMYYLAFTHRYGLDGQHNSMVPLEFTLGFAFGKRSGVFTGVSLPFTWQFRALAEHDLRRPSLGFEYQTHFGLTGRVIFTEGSTQLGFKYTFKY